MNDVIKELLEWIQKRPYWEQVAFLKLLRGESFGNEDYDNLLDLLLHDAGLLLNKRIKKPKLQFPKLPSFEKKRQKTSIKLEEISNTRGINALVDGQTITFGGKMTAIYGGNAVGKSGYARILAAIGSTRGRKELLPDVISTTSKVANPSANIKIDLGNGKTTTIYYKEGKESERLRGCYVFNNESVSAHISASHTIGLTPSNLSLLTELTDVVDEVNRRLELLVQESSEPKDFSRQLHGQSEIASLVGSLSEKTDISKLGRLIVFGKEEKKELEKVTQELAELSISKKNKRGDELEQLATELESLRLNLQNINGVLSPSEIVKINKLINTYNEAQKLTKQISVKSFDTPHFKHVGSELWHDFMRTAKRLALVESEKGEKYPSQGDVCLLCRQELSDESIALLESVWKYLEAEAQHKLAQVSSELESTKDEFDSLDLNLAPESSITFVHLKRFNPKLLKGITSSLKVLKNNRKEIVTSLSKREKVKPLKPIDISAINSETKAIIADIRLKIADLRREVMGKKVEKLNEKKITLEHKKALYPYKAEIISYLIDLKWATSVEKKVKISTRHITVKYDELFTRVVTDKYIATFKQIMKELDMNVKVKVQTKSVKGSAIKQIVLDVGKKTSVTTSPERVLSGGEKRIVAIVDFLTEVSLRKDCYSVVLDDPVVAMDLNSKEALASRIVKEATKRQVILFTHDLVFLHYIDKISQEQGVENEYHCVERGQDNKPGYVSLNSSPALESQFKDAQKARDYYSKANKPGVATGKRNEMVQLGFSALRSSYEYLIIYKLFGGVILRFGERVSFGRLKEVAVNREILDRVNRNMEKISRFIPGHLASDIVGRLVTPANLFKEIEEYEDTKNTLKKLIKDIDQ